MVAFTETRSPCGLELIQTRRLWTFVSSPVPRWHVLSETQIAPNDLVTLPLDHDELPGDPCGTGFRHWHGRIES